MRGSTMVLRFAAFAALVFGGTAALHAETVMQQCGKQYQAAKAGGTLNGMTWNQFRTDCAAKLKPEPAAATESATPAATPAAAPAPAPAANPLKPAAAAPPATPAPAPATTEAAKPAATGGRAAFVARERECGSEWRANKVTLVAQTPGITWPKYLSQCNTRLKAAGK